MPRQRAWPARCWPAAPAGPGRRAPEHPGDRTGPPARVRGTGSGRRRAAAPRSARRRSAMPAGCAGPKPAPIASTCRGRAADSAAAGAHERRKMTQGRGSRGRGQHRRVGYHADARQPGREHIPGHPGREHGARVQGPDLRPKHGADHGRRAGRIASGRRGLPARRSEAAARGPAGLTWWRPPGRPGRPGWRQRLPARGEQP